MTSKNVKETEYYDLFNVKSDASQDEIKKAYLKLATKEHPDKCVDKSPEGIKNATEKFQNITHAYGVLSDSNKRAVYDRHGKSGLDENPSGEQANPFDMFQNIFGGNGFGFNGFNERMTRQKSKPPPTKHVLNVSLADLYTGKDFDIKLKQQCTCTNCQGKGTTNPDAIKRCDTCNGKGQVTQLRQVGPGMIQQSVNVCAKCKGKGKSIPNPKDLCNSCNGEKVIRKDKSIKFNLTAGSSFDSNFQINNMGDEYPDLDEPGDLIIVLNEVKGYNPSNFTRKNNDLNMNVELSLLEAMCGFSLVICQLDKRKLIINHNGKTIQPNDVMKINKEGMSLPNSKNKGDLIIHFTVTLPKNLDNSRKDILKQVLPQNKRNNPIVDDNDIKEVKNLEDFKMSQEQQQHQHQHHHQFQHHENPLEDIGQGVQCAQQ
jgi:DnaJ family protein A protein 2